MWGETGKTGLKPWSTRMRVTGLNLLIHMKN